MNSESCWFLVYADKYLFKHAKRQEITYMPKITPVLKYHAYWTCVRNSRNQVPVLCLYQNA